MPVIVTRPRREALEWVQALHAAGLPALALPLIEIGPPADPAPLQQAWRELARYTGVMFVSANAVDGFFQARPGAESFPALAQGQAWATGPGTAAALRRAGLADACIDAPPADAPQFDSEALWQRVGARIRPGDRVLIVRGGDAPGALAQGVGRDWFARQVCAAGGTVDFVVAYRRQRPALDARQRQLAAQAAGDGSVWLFSSSEAVHNLRACLPDQDWRSARALATHERVAEAARGSGFGLVRVTRPTLAAVIASIESLR